MVNLNSKLTKRLTKEQIIVLKKYVEEKQEIPIRVVYTQEYWDKIAKDTNYLLANREIAALKKSISKLSKIIGNKNVNIVHLGVGNGIETPIILNELRNHINNYSIVDVNSTMLDLAENEILNNNPSINVKKFLIDIETYGIEDICKKTKQNNEDINIIFLIGNGVLFSNEDFVQNIINNLGVNDYFFLTLELYEDGKDNEIIESYMIPTIFDLLANGIRMIGYDPKYEEFSAEIDLKDNRLKMYYSPNMDNSKKLLILHSYKPNIEQLTKRTKNLGLTKVFCEEYKNIHTCACLFNKR